MPWTQSELDALKKAYAAGTLRVSFEGRSVEYGTAADLLSRIRIIEAEMATQSGNAAPKRMAAAFRSAARFTSGKRQPSARSSSSKTLASR